MVEYHNKLVRDRIPEIIERDGKKPSIHIASGAELEEFLRRKLEEELREYQASKNPEELADILEVVYRLANCHYITQEELERMRREKAEQRGAFRQGIILERVE